MKGVFYVITSLVSGYAFSHVTFKKRAQEPDPSQDLNIPANGPVDKHIYRIANKASKTYLDLNNGSPDNGEKIQGWSKAPSNDVALNQQFRLAIVQSGTGNTVWNVQNLRSGTYMEM